MNTTTATLPKRFPHLPHQTPAPDRRLTRRLNLVQLSSSQKMLLVIASLLLVVAIGFLDYWTGPYLSFGAFYLIPVAACAWWGGLSHGLLLALAATSAWCLVDGLENPDIPTAVGVWNGIVRFCILALVSSLLSRLHASMGREHRLARTDPLTGAANGRNFYEATAAAAEHARLAYKPLTLAYFDLDDFKRVNDRLGHATGDEVLRHFADTVHLHLHGDSLLARLGGDEFALLLSGADPQEAADVIGRLHLKLSQEMSSRGWSVTVSIGSVTFLRPPPDVDRLIQYADKLMYIAKKKGKQRVEYNVVHEGHQELKDEATEIERRATARIISGQATVSVRPAEQEGSEEELAVISDISSTQICMRLGQQHAVDTVLLVEPLSCRAKTVLARVAGVLEEVDGWLHRCIMATHLSDEELICWKSSEEEHEPQGEVTASRFCEDTTRSQHSASPKV
jgi:diguanylate cyclase (GGDEF)-like protein